MSNTKKESNKEQEPIKYHEYAFESNKSLEVSAFIIDKFRDFVQEVLDTEGVGIQNFFNSKFDLINKETGVPHTGKKIPAEKMDNFEKIFNFNRTLQSPPDTRLLHLGMRALAMTNLLNQTHKHNVDIGNGILKSELENKNTVDTQEGNQTQETAPKVILES